LLAGYQVKRGPFNKAPLDCARDRQGRLTPFFSLGDKEFGAGDEAVGVGEIIAVGKDDFAPLARGAIVFGGDSRKSIALLDNVDSLG